MNAFRPSRTLPPIAAAWSFRAGVLACCLFFAASAWANVVFTVDSTADDPDSNTLDGKCETAANACTLRAAVMQANHVVNADITIELAAGTYVLGPALNTDGEDSGDLNLIAPPSGNPVITVAGAGNATTIIDGNATDRILTVDAGRTAVISGVTLRNGSFPDPNGSGGGILNHGVLTLSNAVLRDSIAGSCGGGVYNENQLGIYSSTITSNSSTIGGGICNVTGAGLTIVKSTIHTNDARLGGGIDNDGVCVVASSTISGNKVRGAGGGVYNVGTIDFYSSTIVFNKADLDNLGGLTGGGIYNNAVEGANGVVNLRNSVVAGNTEGEPIFGAEKPNDCYGTLSSYGRNRFWVVSNCQVNQVGSGNVGLMVSLAELGPLRDNGGPTRTHALVPPSDLIDGTDPTVGCADPYGPLATDQRGRPRIVGALCDIGAFEYDPNVIFFAGFQ
jgi:CSLREA domain-containing protein